MTQASFGSMVFASVVATTAAFAPTSLIKSSSGATQLNVAVDPTTITTKEYELIKGDVIAEDDMMALWEKESPFLYHKHVDVIRDLEPLAGEMVDEILLETGENAWQPQDFLPDLSQEGWEDEVKELRKAAEGVADDLMVVLVGDMVTEEALPTYQTLLNTFEGCDDPTGVSMGGWARWSRGWTSEENRHGDLLNKYLYLTGKCDMRAIEVTIQHLITNGFNPDARKDPYRGFVYTSFQERATRVSHGNVGKLARQSGDARLGRICAKIAGDEARHERAYQAFSKEILARDADGLLAVFADMMKGQISMPAEQMTDGTDPMLYESFSAVAQRLGVYTAIDYADIIAHLVKEWDLEHLEGLSSQGEKDRDYICNLPRRYRKLAERSMNKKKTDEEEEVLKSFSWIYNRKV